MNFLQSFIILLHFVSIYVHFYVMNGSFAKLNVSFEDSPLDLLCYRVNALKYNGFLYEVGSILILAGAINGMIALCHFVMFKLANQVLLARKHGTGTSLARHLAYDWRRFYRFRLYFITALRHFLYANAWTGKSFATFLLVNFPLNAYMVMFLLTVDLPSRKKLPPIMLVVVQLVAILGLHLAFSTFSTLIHRPSKPLIGLMVRQHLRSTKMIAMKKIGANDHICDQIRLSLCIGAFHTANRYGPTYGKYGLISIASFTKCLMFYGKFLMISYKNIRQIK